MKTASTQKLNSQHLRDLFCIYSFCLNPKDEYMSNDKDEYMSNDTLYLALIKHRFAAFWYVSERRNQCVRV